MAHGNAVGVLTEQMKVKAKELWDDGVLATDIGERFGVSKSAVIGLADRGGWTQRKASPNRSEPSTLFTRLDAAHAKMDAVLAEPRPKTWLPASEMR